MSNLEDRELQVLTHQSLNNPVADQRQRPKQKSTASLLRNVTLIIILFVIFIWNISKHLFLNVKETPKDLKNDISIPTIVWFTNIISSVSKVDWVHRNRRITCSKGVKMTLACDVLMPESQPENPGAYLFYISYLDRFPLPRDPKTIWGLVHDESPVARLVFLFEKALNVFNYSATFSRDSNVPFPLIWIRGLENLVSVSYYRDTPEKNGLLGVLAPVLYMQSDCPTLTERDAYVKNLMKYIQVDSYGDCLHNKDLPLNQIYSNPDGTRTYRFHLYGEELLSFLSQYKFIISIEVGICSDYVTEKFWRAIEVGVVPIYYGSPLIRDWLPNNKSAILLEDFPTPELLSRHLHYLLRNDTAYEEYLEHKTLRLISNKKLINEITARPYQTDLAEVIKEFECLICEKLHDINNTTIDIVTKRHYDCPIPENLSYVWQYDINDSLTKIDMMFEEINSGNRTPRVSRTSWW